MSELLTFDPVSLRILGVLMEKEKTTPEYYPMTVNAIMNACNQKSSRNPVVQYDEATVQIGIDTLRKKNICFTVTGGGSRSIKYKHNASYVLDLDEREESILCLLILRGPLTPGEIKMNSGRLHEFTDLESVISTLEKMRNREIPLIIQLPKRSGQKEARYMHLLGGDINMDEWGEPPSLEPIKVSSNHLEERINHLEKELNDLKNKVSELIKLLE